MDKPRICECGHSATNHGFCNYDLNCRNKDCGCIEFKDKVWVDDHKFYAHDSITLDHRDGLD